MCADTNVVAGDDVITKGCKLATREIPGRASYAIANTGDDANASTMLARRILDELSRDTVNHYEIAPAITQAMKEWQADYTSVGPPSISFMLGALAGQQNARIYYCEPPNTVTRMNGTVAIGCGSRIVDPLIPHLFLESECYALRPTLLSIAYLMYRAKKENKNIAGSGTDLIALSGLGGVRWVTPEEMEKAEAIGSDIDFLFHNMSMGIFSQEPKVSQNKFLATFKDVYLLRAMKAKAVDFPSLDGFLI